MKSPEAIQRKELCCFEVKVKIDLPWRKNKEKFVLFMYLLYYLCLSHPTHLTKHSVRTCQQNFTGFVNLEQCNNEYSSVWRKSSYHFFNSSCKRFICFCLIRSDASASTMDNLLASKSISSLFGTIIAPRRLWSYVFMISYYTTNLWMRIIKCICINHCCLFHRMTLLPGQWPLSVELGCFVRQLLQSLTAQHFHLLDHWEWIRLR